jgi:hypothetical protein
VPFEPDASVLMHRILAGHPSDISERSALPNAYIQRIRVWIEQGAERGELLNW